MLFILLAVPAIADQETLFGSDIESGGFGGPVVKFTQVNSEFAVMTGGRGGWIINHMVVLGGGGYGLASDVDASDKTRNFYNNDGLDIEFGYGGFEIEYINNSDRLIHYTLYTLIGAGGINLHDPDRDNFEHDGDAVFVLEPAINCILNATTWLRIGAGVSYRLVSSVDTYGIDSSDIGGIAASLVFKFGKF
jgi:hypothetical protein